MRRVCLLGLTIAIGLAIGVGVFVTIQPVTPPSFEWAVHTGDTFQYEVRIHGVYPNMGSISPEMFQRILDLNGTAIVANVTYLPLLSNTVNSSSFFASIVNVSKVVCTFGNGSAIDSDLHAIVASAISGCTHPIGGWSYIDSLYPDEMPGYAGGRFIAAKLYPDHFYFAHSETFIDSIEKCSANVTLSNGVPSSVQWMYKHQYWAIYIELALVDS